jgi:hypothetical protein
VQTAPETCGANNERNKKYSVHLVGPELNIYITKTYGTTNKKTGVRNSAVDQLSINNYRNETTVQSAAKMYALHSFSLEIHEFGVETKLHRFLTAAQDVQMG